MTVIFCQESIRHFTSVFCTVCGKSWLMPWCLTQIQLLCNNRWIMHSELPIYEWLELQNDFWSQHVSVCLSSSHVISSYLPQSFFEFCLERCTRLLDCQQYGHSSFRYVRVIDLHSWISNANAEFSWTVTWFPNVQIWTISADVKWVKAARIS